MNTVEQTKNIKTEYISFSYELLNVIFKISLINFKAKKSVFTLVENFQNFFEKNKQKSLNDFQDFLFELNQELMSIDKFLLYNTKKDFKRKDLNLDILIESVNLCISYVENSIDDSNLFNGLTEKFQCLIKKGNISNNKDLEIILTEFNNYIKNYINYMRRISGDTTLEKSELKENVDSSLVKKIHFLENELNKEIKTNTIKEKENLEEKKIKEEKIKELEKKNKILDEAVINNEITRKLDKATYDEIVNKMLTEINNIKAEMSSMEKKNAQEVDALKEKMSSMEKNHTQEVDALKEKMSSMEKNHTQEVDALKEKMSSMEKNHTQEIDAFQKRIKQIEEKNNVTQFKLEMTEKKYLVFQKFVTTEREAILFLLDYARNFSIQLDHVLDNLNNLPNEGIMLDFMNNLFK